MVRRIKYLFLFLILVLQFSLAAEASEPIPVLKEPSLTVHIPMRDGFELTADLYYPKNSFISNEYPCILIRLPGGRKAAPWLPLANLAEYGYVVAIQDTRSALNPEGALLPYLSDGWGVHRDGYDTIEWLASSSFTNGKIGTAGFSAAGVTQLMVAPTTPPSLKCQYIGQAFGSMYHHALFPGGQFQKNLVEMWLSLYAPHKEVLHSVISQPIFNDFWQSFDSMSLASEVEVPAVHYAGWFDPFIQGTIEAFVERQNKGKEGAKGTQKLLIGPWTHFWPKDLTIGDFDVPKNGQQPPIDISYKRWFDYYLKGVDNGVKDLPPVTYYVMGPLDGASSSGNKWKEASSWPIPSKETSLFFSSNKKLSEKLESKEFSYIYKSDPENPVPTVGGRNLFLPSGPKDQRVNELRRDVLTFTTPVLENDLEITGEVFVKLFLKSNQGSIDVAVQLTDVYPDGKSLLLCEGLSRINKNLNSPSKEATEEIKVNLGTTSTVFAKGHCIRVSIAGSNYPRYEHNYQVDPNTHLKTIAISENILFTGKNKPSSLILPVIKN